MKIGFFGGSFNPPTNAHIDLAKKALIECNMDKIVFMPMGDFYEKKGLAKAKDRYNMLNIACSNSKIKAFEVSDLEINIKEKLHAIDAFKLIENEYPNDERYFIMGADNFINLINWKESDKLLLEYNYIVFERENIEIEKFLIENFKNNIPKIIKNVEYNRSSSTEFRNLIKSNTTKNQNIISKEVLDYIIENNIY